MSVRHKKPKPDAAKDLRQKVEELETTTARAQTFAATAFQAQIISDRAAGLNLIDDKSILNAAEAVKFPAYQNDHYYKNKGEIIEYNGLLFEIVAPHRSNETAYPPQTTFAYYRHIDTEHAGAEDDPIPYPETPGIVVNVKKGQFYSYKGSTYRAAADMPHCVYPPDTPGMWQWEKIA